MALESGPVVFNIAFCSSVRRSIARLKLKSVVIHCEEYLLRSEVDSRLSIDARNSQPILQQPYNTKTGDDLI